MNEAPTADRAAGQATEAPRAAPVTAGERYRSLDMLRGVAILGILVMNIYAFAMPFSAYMNPLAWGGTEPWNIGTWVFTHLLFDQKFVSLFAMMFGAGAVLLATRAEARGAKPAPVWYRRQFWLLLIGAVHGYFIWFGDILFVYALMGMLAYLFRKRSPKTLIIVALCLMPVTPVLNYGMSVYMGDLRETANELIAQRVAGETLDEDETRLVEEWEEARAFMAPTEEDTLKDLEIYRGDYAGIVAWRVPQVAAMQFFMVLFYGLWRVLPLMLVGMALMKWGVFTAERSAGFYARMAGWGYALGLPLTAFSAWDLYRHGFDGIYVMRVGGIANYVGAFVVALAHVGLVMWLAKTGTLRGLMDRFAAVGRMALTNYLAHSLIMTTIFYGYGLGLYGEVPRLAQMGFVAALIALQLAWSPWWLARYRFGPAEWAWRSLSYWKRQPMRAKAKAA